VWLAIRPGPAVSLVVMCVMPVQAEVVLPKGFNMIMIIIIFALQWAGNKNIGLHSDCTLYFSNPLMQYYTVLVKQKFGICRIFEMFLKEVSCLPRMHFLVKIWSKQQYFEISVQFNFFLFDYIKNVMYSCDAKLNF